MTISNELVATTAARQNVQHLSSNCCTTCWSRKTFQTCRNLIKPLHRELNLTTHDQTICALTVCRPYCHFPTHAVTMSLLSCTQRVLNRFASCSPSSQADNAQLQQSHWKNSHGSTTSPTQQFSRSGVTLREWRSLSTSWHSPGGQNGNTTGRRWGSHAHQPWGFLLWPQHTAETVLLPRHL